MTDKQQYRAKAEIEAPTRRGLLGLFGLGVAMMGIGGCAAPGHASHLRREPDPSPGEDELTAEEMVGQFLRVVRPGDLVTQDFRLDRVTIDVDDTGRILRVRLG